MESLQYFGTDGIRGTAGKHPMTKEFAFRLGWSGGNVLGRNRPDPVILIGRDTRISGPGLQKALQAGFESSGVRVINLGIFPTPGVAFVTHASEAVAGVVISASHNPAAENGIKFISHDGMKLGESAELEIEGLLEKAPQFPGNEVELGAVDERLRELYVADLQRNAGISSLKDLRIVLDCSNGANYELAPKILRSFGAEPIVLNDHPNGENINAHAGSEYVRSAPEFFRKIIQENRADLGIAFDGDADRVILFDELGRMVDGDQILAILAAYLHRSDRLLGNALVTTTMANGALGKYAAKHGFKFIETPVGDKHVTEKLMALFSAPEKPEQIGIGGEQSGHIVILDEMHRTGDGLRTALWVLKVMLEKQGQKLSELSADLGKFPQLIASATVAAKPELSSLPAVTLALQRLEQELPGLVRANARYSGTEPKFRLMLETDRRHSAEEIAIKAWQICDLLQRETGTPPGSKVEILNVSDGGLMQRPIQG